MSWETKSMQLLCNVSVCLILNPFPDMLFVHALLKLSCMQKLHHIFSIQTDPKHCEHHHFACTCIPDTVQGFWLPITGHDVTREFSKQLEFKSLLQF